MTFDKTLDAVMQLDFTEREMLLEVLNKRMIEEERKKIAFDGMKEIKALKKNKIKGMSGDEAIKFLRTL